MKTCEGSLRLNNVSVDYRGVNALDRVTLSLDPGEAVALIGLSGAGKTTLLKTCNALTKPTSGTVSIDGRELGRISAHELKYIRSRIGFVHQNLSLVPNLRVIQNVVFGRLGRRSFLGGAKDMLFPSSTVIEKVYEILDSVGIAEKIYERTDRLSGGQQQRVAIARALFQNPVILLADEPVSSVDPVRAKTTISLIREICQKKGLTLCVSLHNLDLATTLFPRLIGLQDGQIVFDKTSETLKRSEISEIFRVPEDLMDSGSKTSNQAIVKTTLD